MSSSNCCFLTYIQFSQEAGQVVWYSHLIQNFPQFVVMHIVKGFSIVHEAEVDAFLKFSCFFYDSVDVGNLIPGSSAFSHPAWTSGSSRFKYCWSLTWRILNITLLTWNDCNCAVVWTFLGLPCGSAGKESACNAGDLYLIPGLGRSPGEEKATLSSILAWRIPWTV